MRLYYNASEILLMLSIIEFVMAAPVLVREKPQARVDVVHMPARTGLGKRGGEWNGMFSKLFDHPESHSFAQPELPITRPSSSSQALGLADGSMDVEKPPPSIPKAPLPLSSPDIALPSSGIKPNEMSLNLFGQPGSYLLAKPESSAAHMSSSSQPSGSADGWTGFKQPVPSFPKEPSPVSNPGHAPPSPGDGSNELRLNLFGRPGSYFLAKPESTAAHTSWSSPSGSADGWTGIKRPRPSIPKEPSPASSPVHASPSPSDGSNKMWLNLNLFGRPGSYSLAKLEESSAAHPSWSSQSSSTTDGRTSIKQLPPPNPKELSQLSSPDHAPPSPGDESNKMWLNLNLFDRPGSYSLAKPESSAAHQASSSQPPRPADAWTGVKQPLMSIPKEPSPVSTPDHAPSSTGDGSNGPWLNLFGPPGSYFLTKPETSAAHPSWSSQPSVPADWWTDVKRPLSPIPEEPSPVPSPDDTPPSPGSLTESGYELMKGDAAPWPSGSASSTLSSADHEMMDSASPIESDQQMDASPPNSLSSTNTYPHWMGADSSSGKRKRPWA